MDRPNSQRSAHWYVQVDGTAYGPFDDATLAGFMSEGRVTAQSFLRSGNQGDFRQVTTYPALMEFLSKPESEAQAKITVSLVMAEIRSGRSMAFLQTLQSLGQVQRIGDTTWLLRAHAQPDAICSVLSAPLGPEDRLFVVDAGSSARATFNLGQSVDRAVAELFED